MQSYPYEPFEVNTDDSAFAPPPMMPSSVGGCYSCITDDDFSGGPTAVATPVGNAQGAPGQPVNTLSGGVIPRPAPVPYSAPPVPGTPQPNLSVRSIPLWGWVLLGIAAFVILKRTA